MEQQQLRGSRVDAWSGASGCDSTCLVARLDSATEDPAKSVKRADIWLGKQLGNVDQQRPFRVAADRMGHDLIVLGPSVQPPDLQQGAQS